MYGIVFTRHVLIEEQIEQIPSPIKGYVGPLYYDPRAYEIIVDSVHARSIIRDWFAVAEGDPFLRVFGVFPAILRAALWWSHNEASIYTIETFEPHNQDRAPEGEKPAFKFAGWVKTGEYSVDEDWRY